MKKNRKSYDDDDGRTIASMNVDGMPWHMPGAGKSDPEARKDSGPQEKLQGAERWAFTSGMLKAVVLVTAVFVIGYLLFILFCTKIWFA